VVVFPKWVAEVNPLKAFPNTGALFVRVELAVTTLAQLTVESTKSEVELAIATQSPFVRAPVVVTSVVPPPLRAVIEDKLTEPQVGAVEPARRGTPWVELRFSGASVKYPVPPGTWGVPA
jgi:hypothetical protein